MATLSVRCVSFVNVVLWQCNWPIKMGIKRSNSKELHDSCIIVYAKVIEISVRDIHGLRRESSEYYYMNYALRSFLAFFIIVIFIQIALICHLYSIFIHTTQGLFQLSQPNILAPFAQALSKKCRKTLQSIFS